ncbi:MAG TPA: protein kinase [Pyrinomonadaceae bacterium]|nr:protein kinase [Pyrinomonadaceae bacterium]
MLHCPICGQQYSAEVRVCPEDGSALQADSTIASETPSDPLIGLTLDDKYRIEARLGVGGMGTVYRARHLLIDRVVALKVLSQRFVEDDAAQMRFRREAKAAGRLQHPNAVAVTDFGQTIDGYIYIVMELLEGRTLREILAKDAPLDTARAVALMLQVAAAVAAAHEAGIIHRDLKPANIFIVHNTEVPAVVKVLDFGIAKIAADTLEEDEAHTLTQVGAMIGTPRYMSPEQCNGAELTPAADVYGLGVILYEMLTGVVPFSGSTPLAIAMKHTSELPRPPREFVPSIPEALESVVLHALEKTPSARPADAAEFRRELMITAERLGFEHSAITSGPDLQALRDLGTESPSGRLVVDLSRMRENRAASSGASELTVVSEPRATQVVQESAGAPDIHTGYSFPRVSVQLGGTIDRARRKPLALIGLILVIATVAAVGFFTLRSWQSAAVQEEAIVAPTPTPTPEPTPSPTPAPAREARRTPENANANANENANKKKDSKVNSALKKVGRILKKPF